MFHGVRVPNLNSRMRGTSKRFRTPTSPEPRAYWDGGNILWEEPVLPGNVDADPPTEERTNSRYRLECTLPKNDSDVYNEGPSSSRRATPCSTRASGRRLKKGRPELEPRGWSPLSGDVPDRCRCCSSTLARPPARSLACFTSARSRAV